jgi:rhodanese-related sulfurtransferase
VQAIRRAEVQHLVREGAQLVDVLPRAEYETEHIAGAINIPLKELNRVTASRLDHQRPVIVYCNDYQ